MKDQRSACHLCGLKSSFANADLIRLHGNDGAQSEDEGVNVFHVQVICGHSIGHRVRG